jgi:hypothetical protein
MPDNPFIQSMPNFLGRANENAPGAWDAMHGNRGSAQEQARGFYGGMQHLMPGGGWVNPWAAGGLSNQVAGMTGQMNMHGQGMGRMGQTFEELARRGMHTGMPHDQVMRPGTAGAVAGNLQQWSGAMSAGQNIFGQMGVQNASTPQTMQMLNTFSGGGLGQMSPQQLEVMARRGMNLGTAAGMDMQQTAGVIGAGANLAQSVGLNSTIGAQIGQSSIAFAQAFGRSGGGGGFGGMNKEQAAAKDMQLRTAAAKSPMANMMGAITSMQQKGMFDEGSEGADMAALLMTGGKGMDPERVKKLQERMDNMTSGDFMKLSKESGIGRADAMAFLQSKTANQEQIAQFGLHDKARSKQGRDAGKLRERQLQGAIGASLADSGIAGKDRARLMKEISSSIEKGITEMGENDPKMLEDATARNTKLMESLEGIKGLGGMSEKNKERMIASALQRTEERHLKKDKTNLKGAVDMHRGDILEKQGAEVAAADAKGAAQKAAAGQGQGGWLQRITQAVQNIGGGDNIGDAAAEALGGVPGVAPGGDKRAPNQSKDAPDGQGGGNNMVVSGTLKITGDGQGVFDNAKAKVVAPA